MGQPHRRSLPQFQSCGSKKLSLQNARLQLKTQICSLKKHTPKTHTHTKKQKQKNNVDFAATTLLLRLQKRETFLLRQWQLCGDSFILDAAKAVDLSEAITLLLMLQRHIFLKFFFFFFLNFAVITFDVAKA